MPALYEAIKRSVKARLMKKGMMEMHAEEESERIASATFNKNRKPGTPPITGHHKDKD